MNKIISIALLAGGVVMIIYGVNASDSVSSGFSRMFNGAPTDKTLWLLIGGSVVTAVGLGGLLCGNKP
jgi:hypothetical protein